MDGLLALLVLSLVPQDCCRVEQCGEVELNHIVTVSPDPWGGQPNVSMASYWLGRRDVRECEDIWVVDWWAPYNDERVWRTERGVLIGITDRRTGSLVVVEARRWRQTTTDYDIEVEQQRMILERWGLKADEYRRGLAR